MDSTELQPFPDHGCMFFEIDKRQAEWVVVAYLAQDARMIDVHETGKDPHTTTGSLISNLSPELVKEEHKLVGHLTDPEAIHMARRGLSGLHTAGSFLPRSMSIRQAGKKSNHGLNYNMGYRRFALENEMDETDAKRIVELYFDVYAGIKATFHENTRRTLRDHNRTLENFFGRKRRFLGYWNDELFDAAYSYIPQSTISDMVNRAIRAVYYDTRPWMVRGETLAQVHDSVLGQYPLTHPRDFAAFLAEYRSSLTPTISYHGRDFVIHSDLKLGFNWGHHNGKTNPLGMHELTTTWEVDNLEDKIKHVWEESKSALSLAGTQTA